MVSLHALSVINSNSEMFQESYDDGGEFIIVAFIIWFISLFIVRWLMKKYVLKLMNRSSSKVLEADPVELKNEEIKAKNQPEIIEVDLQTNLTDAALRREAMVEKAYGLFKKKYFLGLLCCFLYLIPYFIAKIAGEDLGENRMAMLLGFVIIYVMYITLNFYFYRKQFRALDATFGVRIEHPYIIALRKIVNPKWEFYFTIGLILMIFMMGLQDIGLVEPDPEMDFGDQAKAFGWGLLMASIFHFILLFKLRRRAQQEENQSLLILRVFGNKKQTLLTFGRLTKFWEHFGSWFTIVDPSFIGRKYRTYTWRTLFTLIFLFILAVFIGMNFDDLMIRLIKPLANGKLSDSEIEEMAIIPGIVIAWILYLTYWKISISRSYTKNKEDIDNRIRKLMKRPRRYDLSYKSLPMFCYDNTWKIAVNELLKNSKVILMDLRGFSEERKGCEYEVDFIFDNFPISRILFLVDGVSDRELVKHLILDRWEYLKVHSPNLDLKNPKARIFISEKGAQEDVQTIIDLLIDGLENSKN